MRKEHSSNKQRRSANSSCFILQRTDQIADRTHVGVASSHVGVHRRLLRCHRADLVLTVCDRRSCVGDPSKREPRTKPSLNTTKKTRQRNAYVTCLARSRILRGSVQQIVELTFTAAQGLPQVLRLNFLKKQLQGHGHGTESSREPCPQQRSDHHALSEMKPRARSSPYPSKALRDVL